MKDAWKRTVPRVEPAASTSEWLHNTYIVIVRRWTSVSSSAAQPLASAIERCRTLRFSHYWILQSICSHNTRKKLIFTGWNVQQQHFLAYWFFRQPMATLPLRVVWHLRLFQPFLSLKHFKNRIYFCQHCIWRNSTFLCLCLELRIPFALKKGPFRKVS